MPDADALIREAARVSRYVGGLLTVDPQLLPPETVFTPFSAEEMHAELAQTAPRDEAQLASALRRLRKRVMLRVIVRDIGGLASLEEVITTVSALADLALGTATTELERLLSTQFGEPTGEDTSAPQKLHIVGMGKLGGNELNVSSDIDLVFVYPEEGETLGGPRPLSNHEYFIKLSRRLIGLLNEMTADGYVFRVDMRLRPLGADGPLACCFGMLENYFVTQGRAWERYAWIKARVVCGDRAGELLELVRPFVFRRHLDYSAFESLRELHREIRREVERRDILEDIKLGPGGIREIEFIVQLFQLVRGGREPALRTPSLLAALPLLAERNLLPPSAIAELREAYVFLRRLEHRLQYLDDKQTQRLPDDAQDQELIASAMGSADYAQFYAELQRQRDCVTRHFESIFAASREDEHPLAGLWDEASDQQRNVGVLEELGYLEPQQTLARISAFRASSRVRQMPEASRSRMRQLVALVVETCARLPGPDVTLTRMLMLLESVSRREAYLALLQQYPQTIERGARLANASPWAAEYLAQHPILLDELLDPTTLYAVPDWHALGAALRAQIDQAAGDTERQMDLLRHFKHSQTMHLIAQDLAERLSLEKLSDHLSELADLILAEVLRATWRMLPARHREEPRFAIIAYGKLGGKELGYASDLDLIFLHHDDAPEAIENYVRTAPRLNNWLNTLTPAGVLYETDLRLRPDGISGLLVSSLEGYANYQRDQAWVWEHQALTRARFVAGDAEIGARFEAIRIEVLRKPRPLDELRTEIVAMRRKMLAAHPNPTEKFDLKHDRGGLIDVEFIVQYLVLGFSHLHPELTGNIGNLALLKLAAKLGLITADESAAAHDAYRRFRQSQHALRLQGDKYARVDVGPFAADRAAVQKLWAGVLEKHIERTPRR